MGKLLDDFMILLVSLGIILLGAQVFTNGIEWFGKKLNLAEGAVGSLLAAVGTALPETMVPLFAILFGTEEVGNQIGIGAILGAPFMLATLAFFMSGAAGVFYKNKRKFFPKMNIDINIIERDLSFFVILYTTSLFTAFVNFEKGRFYIACFLIVAYFLYVIITIKSGQKIGTDHNISPCIFDKKRPNNPSLFIVLLQIFCGLTIIILGAKYFVNEIEKLSLLFGIPSFILALIIAPIATELPEKFNSIIWIAQGKDTLALGNITGAMVFQSSLIPALGILLTPWNLNFKAVISVALALASALLLLFQIKRNGYITVYMLMICGLFYITFIFLVAKRILI